MKYNASMSDAGLTQERILEAAEDVLRRFGPSKATVVDVARALGVSHGSVYRHFASKAELREAVTRIWLARMNDALEAIVAEDAPAEARLMRWLRELIAIKRRRLSDDPELFATYCALTEETRKVVEEHISHLTDQVSRIIAEGVADGEFYSGNPTATARAVLSATSRFHNPVHAAEWAHPTIDRDFEEVSSLLLSGLKAKPR